MDHSILDTEVSNTPRIYVAAGAGLRLANLLIDTIGYFVACFICGIILGLSGLISFIQEGVYANLFAAVVYILYYMLSEGLSGRTLGKLVTGTKVLNENDEQPSFLNILGRTICRLIPFEAFSFLGSGYGWHDSISNTKVVVIKEKVTKKR